MSLPTRLPLAIPAAVVLTVAAIAGCASNRVDAEWTDPAQRGHVVSLRGASVLIACEAPDVAVRNICQERFAAQVASRGSRPVFVPSEAPIYSDRALDPQLLPGAREANAGAVLVITLRPVATEDDRSSVSFGIGGFGFGGRSGGGGALGLTTPIGEGHVATGFSANGRVTDVASGRLVWSATAAASPSENLDAQLDQLSRSLLDSASRSGLF